MENNSSWPTALSLILGSDLNVLEKGSLTPQAAVLVVAFKVYSGRDEKFWKQNFLMLAKAFWLATLWALMLPGLPKPENLWVLVSNVVRRITGPWACLNPCKLPRTCPRCHQEGQCSFDCTYVPHSMGTSSPNHPSADFLGIAWTTEGVLGCLLLTTAIPNREPQVDITVQGRSSSFFLDTRTTYLVLKEF